MMFPAGGGGGDSRRNKFAGLHRWSPKGHLTGVVVGSSPTTVLVQWDGYGAPSAYSKDTTVQQQRQFCKLRVLKLRVPQFESESWLHVTFVCQNFPCHNVLNQQKGPSMRMGIEIALSLLVILGLVAIYRHTNPPTGKK